MVMNRQQFTNRVNRIFGYNVLWNTADGIYWHPNIAGSIDLGYARFINCDDKIETIDIITDDSAVNMFIKTILGHEGTSLHGYFNQFADVIERWYEENIVNVSKLRRL